MIEPNKTFPLAVPVTVGGQSYDKLILRRPKGREIRELRNGSARPGAAVGDLTVTMMANLAEVPEEVFDELDGGDFRAVENWLETLLGN